MIQVHTYDICTINMISRCDIKTQTSYQGDIA